MAIYIEGIFIRITISPDTVFIHSSFTTFFDLKNLKIKFYRYEIFPDHFDYKESDLQKLKDLAKIENCELLTTEKDYFRIKKSFRKSINFLKVELLINQHNQFYKYLKEKL